MELAHKVQAYIAVPPLFNFASFPTTVDPDPVEMESWEQQWSEALRG
jgi:hypothetical protein